MGEARQRRPTKNANRFVYNGLWASHVSCSCFTLRQVWQNTRRWPPPGRRGCRNTAGLPNPADLVVVEYPVHSAAGAAHRFFPRHWSRRTRAFGSPKTPRTVARGRNPGKRYASASRRNVRIRQSCHIFSEGKTHKTLIQQRVRAFSYSISPTRFGEDPSF